MMAVVVLVVEVKVGSRLDTPVWRPPIQRGRILVECPGFLPKFLNFWICFSFCTCIYGEIGCLHLSKKISDWNNLTCWVPEPPILYGKDKLFFREIKAGTGNWINNLIFQKKSWNWFKIVIFFYEILYWKDKLIKKFENFIFIF